MKGICITGAMKKDRASKKKVIFTNEKETKRAIKAAVDKAKEVDEMEKYRNADRFEEAVRIGKNHEVE